ncbi:hypothetical protein BDR05DRAFT_1061964, partial [Suillus weaverae]
MLFSYLKRRYQRAREKVNHEPALLTSEASQVEYLPPPPRLDAAYPNPHYPFSAPAPPSSYYSPTYSIPYDTSASATLNAPAAGSSSNSEPE